MHPILLFDIDGTLLKVDSTFMRGLIAEMLAEYQPSLNIDELAEIPFAGRTDKAIFNDLIQQSRLSEHTFEEIKDAYIATLNDHLHSGVITVFEPVREVLDYCRQENMISGLLTGNFEEVAYLKTRLAGIDHHFPFGAFGCDHAERNLLPEVASQKASHYLERDVLTEHCVLIGDTPHDIEAGKHAGCKVVAVTTGFYEKETLKEHEPDLLLDSLEQPHKWIPEVAGLIE